mmetsp:Transcript_91450/g.237022  ORF Transcript_91450/g.237022 Transcript_91450/m.237022 type:complete len:333 (-) Transcript_91450:71-1069(-)
MEPPFGSAAASSQAAAAVAWASAEEGAAAGAGAGDGMVEGVASVGGGFGGGGGGGGGGLGPAGDGAARDGEATVATRSVKLTPVKFFSTWRCPYAHRAWIGLEEKSVNYQWVQIDKYRRRDNGRCLLTLEDLGKFHPAFIACSPRGQIPALDNDGEHVQDSLILLEYIHEAFDGPPLLPTTPGLRAKVRLWTKFVDLHIVPHFDRLLAAHDAGTRAEARQQMMDGLALFEAAMAPEAEGPFFLGDDFSMADIALAPWWLRMVTVLRAYRKFDPHSCPRLQAWYEAVEARPSFQRTKIDPERLIEEFSDCADLEESTRFRRISGASLHARGHR